MISLNMLLEWVKLHRLVRYNSLSSFRLLKIQEVNFLYFLLFIELICYRLSTVLEPNYTKTTLIFNSFFFKYDIYNTIKVVIDLKNMYGYAILNRINIVLFNLRWVALAALISIFYAYISIFYIQIDFTKQIAV